MTCLICRALAAFEKWHKRRHKLRALLTNGNNENKRPPHGELPPRQAIDNGWRRVNTAKDFQKSIPDDWQRKRRHLGN